MINPADGFLPPFLDPLLEYLSANLPSPLYSFLVSVLSHSFAAVTAIAGLCCSLLSKNEWNTQTLLPPIITILAAYLALASLYRTTTWAIRVSFWFIKWGALLGIMLTGAGYFMGNTARDAVSNDGVIPVAGQIISSLFSGQGIPENRKSNSRVGRMKKSRPKPWDTFERHNQWQYQQENERQGETVQAEHLMAIVTDAVGHAFGVSNWWNAMKNLGKDASQSSHGEEQKRRKGATRGKGRSGSSRSR